MSYFGSVTSYAYKWWYGAEMSSKPWRTVNWNKSEIEESMRNLTPSNPDIGHLRILLHGPVGTGKSSFINSLNSVFQHRVITRVKTAPSSATSCTTKYTGHRIKYISSETLPVTIFDFMGLEEMAQNVHPGDITNALHGHLPNGYKFNAVTPLSANDPGYISDPSPAEKIHCFVCVVSANSISRLPNATIDKMKMYLQEASDLGIPQAIIMTMGDLLCPAVNYNMKNIYYSKAIKAKMQKCSETLQVSLTSIFPVKNYHDETETKNDMDILLLLALKQIIHFANDYAEDL